MLIFCLSLWDVTASSLLALLGNCDVRKSGTFAEYLSNVSFSVFLGKLNIKFFNSSAYSEMVSKIVLVCQSPLGRYSQENCL